MNTELLHKLTMLLKNGPIAIFLVLYAAYFIVEQTFFYLEAEQYSNVSAEQLQAINQEPTKQFRFSQATLGLFGDTDQEVVQVVSAPTTRLNLELEGIFKSDPDTNSSAIIAERGKSGRLYFINDMVPGNAKLHEVNDDHVLLMRQNRLEKLEFSSQNLLTKANEMRPGSELSQERTGLNRPNNSPRPATLRSGSEPVAPTYESDAEFRNSMIQNPDDTLKQLGFEAIDNASPSGYRVNNNSLNPLVQRSGLRTGDVVRSINGMPIGIAANDARLIDQVKSTGRARVEVDRDGRRFFLTVPVP